MLRLRVRSLNLAAGLMMSSLALATPMAQAQSGPTSALDPGTSASEKAYPRSGAYALQVAYYEALQAHLDASAGQMEESAGHLRVARDHLAEAAREVGSGSAPSGLQPEKPGHESNYSPHQMPGGGGGAGGGAMISSMSSLEELARRTESDINMASTTRLVAALTTELRRMGRMGGGGGPTAPNERMTATAIEHLDMAYASIGQAQSALAMKDWQGAADAVAASGRHLDEAKKAPGSVLIKQQVDRLAQVVKDAEGPVKARSAKSGDAVLRVVREMTNTISDLGERESSEAPSHTGE